MSEEDKQEIKKYKRQLFIDQELFWQGRITRSAIVKAFGVREDTAKDDIKRYCKDAPEIKRDTISNIYKAPPDFRPKLEERIQAEEYLNWLAGGPLFLPKPNLEKNYRNYWKDKIETVPKMARNPINSTCLRKLIGAIRDGKEIEIVYKSPHQKKPKRLWIYPHAFSCDSFRWSCRCWRYDYNRWGEVVLDRIEQTFDFDGKKDLRRDPPADKLKNEKKSKKEKVANDQEWDNKIKVVLKPHPDLTVAAKEAIEKQYDMKNGELSIELRRSQVVYFLKRYQLEEPEGQSRKAPHQQPLVVKNRKEITDAIPKRMRIPPES